MIQPAPPARCPSQRRYLRCSHALQQKVPMSYISGEGRSVLYFIVPFVSSSKSPRIPGTNVSTISQHIRRLYIFAIKQTFLSIEGVIERSLTCTTAATNVKRTLMRVGLRIVVRTPIDSIEMSYYMIALDRPSEEDTAYPTAGTWA